MLRKGTLLWTSNGLTRLSSLCISGRGGPDWCDLHHEIVESGTIDHVAPTQRSQQKDGLPQQTLELARARVSCSIATGTELG